MPWNEPGKDKDPWGQRNNDAPPDLDEVFKNLKKKLNSVLGGGRSGGGGAAGGGSVPLAAGECQSQLRIGATPHTAMIATLVHMAAIMAPRMPAGVGAVAGSGSGAGGGRCRPGGCG